MTLTIMLVAAEPSGDALGASLAAALKRRLGPGLKLVGVGGPRMAAEGIDSPFDIAELSILGWIDGLRAYPRVRRRVADAAALAARHRPDAAILIDSWGYTLRVARALRALDPHMRLIKYVGPQVWASRPGRAKTLARAVDHLLAIHVFDPPWFEKEGLSVSFVGNPAVHVDFSSASGERFRTAIGVNETAPVLLILPGSRASEIRRMTPVFEAAATRLTADNPALRIVVAAAESVEGEVVQRVAAWPFPVHLALGEAARHDAMKGATAALACSGSVTLELAAAGCPVVVAYRLDELTYQLARRMVKIDLFTLFNLAAGEAVAPEFIQHAATPEALARAVADRLYDPGLRQAQRRRQFEALTLMGRGGPDPSEAAADAVLKALSDPPQDQPRAAIGT